MKLYEVMKLSEADYDTYDTVFDACVTVCYIDEEHAKDSYDKFCIGIMKKVEVVRIIPTSHLTCDWSKLIYDNMENSEHSQKRIGIISMRTMKTNLFING